MGNNVVRYSYWIACLATLSAGFFLMAFAEQEILDTGEISGEMPIEAGMGGLLIELSLAGMLVGGLFKVFNYFKNKQRCLK